MSLAIVLATPARAAETCRFTGTTSYDGQVSVETVASAANGEMTIDVRARVGARSFGFVPWQYWLEEISVWRGDALQSIAVNHRYAFAGQVIRQSWDTFTAGPTGMTAQRIQANSIEDLQKRHSGFVRHWDPATFGASWLKDFPTGAPERRADLDLPAAEMPPRTGSPLALAFYWVRWAGEQTVPVFLPGFKRNARVDVSVVSVGVEAGGMRHLRSTVRHPQLNETEPSVGDAWVSADRRLTRITFDAHGARGGAHGELRSDGCQGDAPGP